RRAGFPFGLGTSLCSTVALRTNGADVRLAIGTDSGKVFYLPIIANNK
ncbi:MAG: hypothetical protein HYT87_19670, partial [Nitrospirae bacterium]|nr:hypothetical protein [Nitrospirota bacterium]